MYQKIAIVFWTSTKIKNSFAIWFHKCKEIYGNMVCGVFLFVLILFFPWDLLNSSVPVMSKWRGRLNSQISMSRGEMGKEFMCVLVRIV